MTNIKQNLFIAFVYNVAGIPIAVGVLYPFTGADARRLGDEPVVGLRDWKRAAAPARDILRLARRERSHHL